MLRKSVMSSIFSTLTRDSLINLGQVILLPLFLVNFGTKEYSTWLTILSYTSFILLADFGLSNVIVGRLINFYDRYLSFDVSLWVWFKRRTYFMAIFMTVVTWTLFYINSSENLFKNFPYNQNLQLFTALTLSSFVTISQHFWLYRMQALGHNSYAQRKLTVFRLYELIFFVMLLQVNLTISLFSWLFLFIKLIIFMGLKLNLKKFPKVEISENSQPNISGILGPTTSHAFVTSANVMSIHGSFIIASIWLSPTDLISLAIARMLSSPIRIFGSAILLATLPYFIQAHQSKKLKEENLLLLNLLVRKAIILISVISIGMVLLSEYAWSFLSNQMVPFSKELVVFFCISTLCDAVLNLRFQGYLASNTALISSTVYFSVTTFLTFGQMITGSILGVIAVPVCIIGADLVTLIFLVLSKVRNEN